MLKGLLLLSLTSFGWAAPVHAQAVSVDLDRYCMTRGWGHVQNVDGTGYGWRCSANMGNISVVDACKEQQGATWTAILLTPVPGKADDWRCTPVAPTEGVGAERCTELARTIPSPAPGSHSDALPPTGIVVDTLVSVREEPRTSARVLTSVKPLTVKLVCDVTRDWLQVDTGDFPGTRGIVGWIPRIRANEVILFQAQEMIDQLRNKPWSMRTKADILTGHPRLGFTEEQVRLAAGDPYKVETGPKGTIVWTLSLGKVTLKNRRVVAVEGFRKYAQFVEGGPPAR